jgi:hypothetical protein
MPEKLTSKWVSLKSLDDLPKRLNAVNMTTLMQARAFRAQTTLDPATVAKARRMAKDTVRGAKAKAVARRSATVVLAMDAQARAMTKAHTRIKQTLQDGSRRSPAVVIQSFLNRARRNQRELTRGETSSLLIRSSHQDVTSFTRELIKVMGLQSARQLAALNVQVRQVAPGRAGRAATYSVRLPVKRRSVSTEIHNFAWALRQSRRFISVRPDGSRKLVFAAAPTHAKRAERVFAWHLLLTRTLEAHALPPQPNGRALGEGIVIAHPDTGWAPHPQYHQLRIDVARSFNAGSGDIGGQAACHSVSKADAEIPQIAHGTATASVIVGGNGSGDASSKLVEDELAFPSNLLGGRDYGASKKIVDSSGALTGVAPLARVRPIKFIDDIQADIDRTGLNGAGVVRIADEDLVTALTYARTSGAHVVSLSIGGFFHDSVREAIDLAVENNLIIVAAAGQTYTMEGINKLSTSATDIGLPGFDTVVLPAAYANVLAVAGCSPDGRPWDESLRGPNVDITAPGDGLWVADFDHKNVDQSGRRLPVTEAASGTSFAASFMAGVAALWLAHWGRDELLARYLGVPLAWVFRHQLQLTANAAHVKEWDHTNYGPGVVDVRALLEKPLPMPQDVKAPPATTANVFTVLSGGLDTPGAELARDAWAILYDLGVGIGGSIDKLGDAAWAAARAVAETMVQMGEQALEDLNIYIEVTGGRINQATREAIDAVTGFVEVAAEVAEDAAEAAAEAGDSAVEAVVDFAEDTVDALGEAGEDVVDFLFGWAV